jgi:serine/threonine-protein kinase HipA
MSELVAYLAGRTTGRLILKENGNLQFRYDGDYSGPPISQALPVQPEAHPHAACQAVFGGLLLEGEPRETLARNIGVSAGNDFALLQEVGGDCAGAIVLLRPDVPVELEPRTRPLDQEALDGVLRGLPQRPLAADPEEGVRLSLAGAQPKLPVIIENGRVALPLTSAAATTHIIKPEPRRFPGLVQNEGYCMRLARDVGLPVARVEQRATVSGITYLLVERYDRDLTAEPIRRLHQEDVCQALGRASDRKYQAEGGPSAVETVELLRRCSTVPARDLPTFWRSLVFNWLIGNCDAHAKNFSLLYDAGAPTLAPLYDLLSTTVYPDLTRRLAMSIGGARDIDDVDPDSWEALARSAGYSMRFARSATRAMIDLTVESARALLDDPSHDNQVAREICAHIESRAAG